MVLTPMRRMYILVVDGTSSQSESYGSSLCYVVSTSVYVCHIMLEEAKLVDESESRTLGRPYSTRFGGYQVALFAHMTRHDRRFRNTGYASAGDIWMQKHTAIIHMCQGCLFHLPQGVGIRRERNSNFNQAHETLIPGKPTSTGPAMVFGTDDILAVKHSSRITDVKHCEEMKDGGVNSRHAGLLSTCSVDQLVGGRETT